MPVVIHGDNFNSQLVSMRPLVGAVRRGSKLYGEIMERFDIAAGPKRGRSEFVTGTVPNLINAFCAVISNRWPDVRRPNLASTNAVLNALPRDVRFVFNANSYAAWKTEFVTPSLFRLGRIGYCEMYTARYALDDFNPLGWQSFIIDREADQYVFGGTRVLSSDLLYALSRQPRRL